MRYSTFFRRSQGFSMVEIMVGVAIAMIGMVVMFQSMQSWESRKRTTSSGSDAQVSGSIALFSIERDIKMAGYGIGAANELGCTVKGYDTGRSGAIPDFPMVPVLITQGLSGTPDIVTVLYGNASTTAAGYAFTASTNTTKTSNNTDGLKAGDLFIAADLNSHCNLLETTINSVGSFIVTHATSGTYTNDKGVATTVRYNNTSAMTIPEGTVSGTLYNLGPKPRLNVWQLAAGRLAVNNVIVNETANQVAEGIVNLQAQYLDASGNEIFAATAPANSTEWRTVRAVRIALLSRSQHYDPALIPVNRASASANPVWHGGPAAAPLVSFAMNDLNATSDSDPDNPNNWRGYRYRVYEAVIPLRNIAWGG
jgi:type IV pilus assembly protein PilW